VDMTKKLCVGNHLIVYDLKMDFSFGIVTGGGCDGRIKSIIASIEALAIPN
jgi:hypothetical protein